MERTFSTSLAKPGHLKYLWTFWEVNTNVGLWSSILLVGRVCSSSWNHNFCSSSTNRLAWWLSCPQGNLPLPPKMCTIFCFCIMHQSESSFRIFLLIELLPVISTTLKLVVFWSTDGCHFWIWSFSGSCCWQGECWCVDQTICGLGALLTRQQDLWCKTIHIHWWLELT